MAATNYTNLESRGYFPLSVGATAVAVTSTYAQAASATSAYRPIPNYMIIRPETQAIRWRDDGTAPVAAVSGGQPLAVGESLEYDGELGKFQMIAQTGTATVNVTIYNAS